MLDRHKRVADQVLASAPTSKECGGEACRKECSGVTVSS